MSTLEKNEPTTLENTLAYIIWIMVAAALYSFVLKPRGWTISRGISKFKGKSSKNDKKPPPKKIKKPVISPKPITVEPINITPTPKSPPRHIKKKSLSEDDD